MEYRLPQRHLHRRAAGPPHPSCRCHSPGRRFLPHAGKPDGSRSGQEKLPKGRPCPTILKSTAKRSSISISACPIRPAVSAAMTGAWPTNFGSVTSLLPRWRQHSCWLPSAAPPALPTLSRSNPFAPCTTSCRSSKSYAARPSTTAMPTLRTCAARFPCAPNLIAPPPPHADAHYPRAHRPPRLPASVQISTFLNARRQATGNRCEKWFLTPFPPPISPHPLQGGKKGPPAGVPGAPFSATAGPSPVLAVCFEPRPKVACSEAELLPGRKGRIVFSRCHLEKVDLTIGAPHEPRRQARVTANIFS